MADKCPFKVGDIVQLKSGGPKMTVSEVVESWTTKEWTGDVKTSWFAGSKHEHAEFDVDTLEPATIEPKK